ncbi:OsmC family protein [Mycoplana dimorpha]|uniref:Putative OsmC-like protein n=1 Tax=Mycoplana dimorpha TaxID=28320 RepID=A0A2T5B8W0_MYCDI|nr:OsmC family protein [Mycoplana dimorpha]PTM95421.1 putative OsmC-like protein [Mycoplana dimorpha]
MNEARVKTRPTGATATLGRTGFPHVTSATGGTLDIVTGASQPGFNPLDLLYASLAACLTISARMAASRMGVLANIEEIAAVVTGQKAADGLARVERFDIAFTIRSDLDAPTREAIARAAEDEICTVSNTIRGNPHFVTTVSG